MTHDEMIAILEAERDGKTVECRAKAIGAWIEKTHIGIDPGQFDYRIKPQSLRGEGWINPDNTFPRIWPTKIDEFTIHIRWEQIMEDEA